MKKPLVEAYTNNSPCVTFFRWHVFFLNMENTLVRAAGFLQVLHMLRKTTKKLNVLVILHLPRILLVHSLIKGKRFYSLAYDVHVTKPYI